MKDNELRSRVWTGVIPSWIAFGEPLPSNENRLASIPDHVTEFVETENKTRKGNAVASVSGKPLGYDH